MPEPNESRSILRLQESVHEKRAVRLSKLEGIALVLGLCATALRHGLRKAVSDEGAKLQEYASLGAAIVLLSVFLIFSYSLRYRWSLRRTSFLTRTWPKLAFAILWTAGFMTIQIFGPILPVPDMHLAPRIVWYIRLSESLMILLGIVQAVQVSRALAARGVNPALLLVGSFGILITVGTLLLMLPAARAGYHNGAVNEGAPFLTALFTGTSASCVTGLVVEPTGEYWSRFGQNVILALFQIGGLGIMTCGALFVALAGRNMQIQETATLRKMLGSDRLSDVRRLLLTILVFTLAAELVGALLMSGLWSDLPWSERIYHSIFHSVSAFCNAGFSLTPDSFVGYGHRWQIWFGATSLIITGGLGFGVIYNLYRVITHRWFAAKRIGSIVSIETSAAPRLGATTRLVLWATILLLCVGTVGVYLLESIGPGSASSREKNLWVHAWFQSVTFRTAGFNTIDLHELQTTTKLFAIGMMFIGASPGSTGGGVKTVCIAVIFLSILSFLRGKERVELGHRQIPTLQVERAFLIVTLGIGIVMLTAFLLVVFEQKPHRLIDHLFEATSAFGTVGLSTGITSQLSAPSRVVIVIAMFIGRVGPLTLMMALATREQKHHYDLPEESVALG